MNQKCEKCGSRFTLRLCVVHESEQQGRITATLCYSCRDEESHRVINKHETVADE